MVFNIIKDKAKERLQFTAEVSLEEITAEQMEELGYKGEEAITVSSNDLSKHSIYYLKDVKIYNLYHEFCHVKINEIGFKTAEIRVRKKYQPNHFPKNVENALQLVAEAFAQWILLTKFGNESKQMVKKLNERFKSKEVMQEAYKENGRWIIAYISIHKIVFETTGRIFPEEKVKQVLKEIRHAQEYDVFNEDMRPLREIIIREDIKKFGEFEIGTIINLVEKLAPFLPSRLKLNTF